MTKAQSQQVQRQKAREKMNDKIKQSMDGVAKKIASEAWFNEKQKLATKNLIVEVQDEF